MAAPKLQLVIEGIGNVVQRYYAEPLRTIKKQYRGDVSITFVDDSRHWSAEEKKDKYGPFVKRLKGWARFIDKHSQRGEYDALRPDVVFIATPDVTHVELARSWLSPPNRCGQIFIEKPLSADLGEARDLLFQLKWNDPKCRALDHYCARALPITEEMQLDNIRRRLGGRIKSFTFYFLENGSGPPHGGPIENEFRVKALKNGLILDLMPHVLGVLSYFGAIQLLRAIGLKAGRYTYVGPKGGVRKAGIKNETFAHVRFVFPSYNTRELQFIKGDAYIGKGVGSVERLGMKGEVKLLELEGVNGRTFRFDFRKEGDWSSTAYLIYRNGKRQKLCDLYSRPYMAIIDRVVRQRLKDPQLQLKYDLPIETAKSVLQSIEEMRHPLKRRTAPLPTYHIGRGGDEAPDLYDILDGLEAIQPFQDIVL